MKNKHTRQLVSQIAIFLTALAGTLIFNYVIATRYTSFEVELVVSFMILICELVIPDMIVWSILPRSDIYAKFKSFNEWKKGFFGINSKRTRAIPYKYLYAAMLIGGLACIPDILFNYPLLAITFHLIALTLSIHNARLTYRQFRKPDDISEGED